MPKYLVGESMEAYGKRREAEMYGEDGPIKIIRNFGFGNQKRWGSQWYDLGFVTDAWDVGRVDTITASTALKVSEWRSVKSVFPALAQGTAANQPTVANGELTFDGSAYFLGVEIVGLVQPATVIGVLSQTTGTTADTIWDGYSGNTMRLYQANNGAADLTINAGSDAATNTDAALGTYSIVSAVYNGASSSLGVNLETRTTGNAGAGDGGGVYLGQFGNGGSYAAFKCKAFAICTSALTSAQLTQVINAMNAQYVVF